MADQKKYPSVKKEDETDRTGSGSADLLKKLQQHNLSEQEDDSGDQGSVGTTGSQVRIYLPGADTRRTDQLSPGEIKRLLIVLADTHKARVDRQRHERRDRLERKSPGELNVRRRFTVGIGGGSGIPSRFKQHPALKEPPHNGRDPKVTSVVTDSNQSNLNPDLRNELQNKLQNQNRLTLQYQRKFIPPTPRPY